MASVLFSVRSLATLKSELRKEYPEIKSSYLTEAIAAALHRRTHAALLVDLQRSRSDVPAFELLDDRRFNDKLVEFGYPEDPEFSFEFLAAPDVVRWTFPPSAHDIEYKTSRQKAWRNLMVLAINEALKQHAFTLIPGDNRWRSVSDGNVRIGHFFKFAVDENFPCLGWVSDIGFDELAIHVALNPIGDGIKVGNPNLRDGDAIAYGWLERRTGAWLQSSCEQFHCRKALLAPLANLSVRPKGFGDRGRK